MGMAEQGVPEIEDATDLSDREYKNLLADESEWLLQNSDILELYMEAGFTDLYSRLIQIAVTQVMDEGTHIDWMTRAFSRDFRTDDANFAVWIDLMIRQHLPAWMLTLTAFYIQQDIYSRVDEIIDEMARANIDSNKLRHRG
jgi:hypothetical protein